MAVRICSTVPLARASASGLDRRHCASSALRTASSTRRRPAFQPLVRLAGHRPGLLPALLDGAQRGPGGPHVGHRAAAASASSSSAALTAACSRSSFSLAEYTSERAGEERVLGRLEPAPQLFLVGPAGPARRLPGPHQLPVGRGGRAPVGRGGQRLGLGDQLLLARLGLLALLLQAGEVGLAPLGERVAGRGQPLPQRGLHRPVGPWRGLPLLQQLAHPLAADLPVRGLGRDLLGLGDDPLLDRSCASTRACSRAARTSSRRPSTWPVSASSRAVQRVQVTDRVARSATASSSRSMVARAVAGGQVGGR